METIRSHNPTDSILLSTNLDITRKVLSKKCMKHPGKNLEFLHLVSNSMNPKICISCIQEEDISSKNYLYIKDILQATSECELFSYPILKDPQLCKIIKNNARFVDSAKDSIDSFYGDLSKLIQETIDRNKQRQKHKLIELAHQYELIMFCWKEITDIARLQDYLFDQESDAKLVEFIENHLTNTDSNTQKIKQLCDQFDVLKSAFAMQQPNLIKDLVCSGLEKINFFDCDNLQYPLYSMQQCEQLQLELQNKQREVDDIRQQIYNFNHQAEENEKTTQSQQIIINELQSQMDDLLKEIVFAREDAKQEKERSIRLREQFNNQIGELARLKTELAVLKPEKVLTSNQLILSTHGNSSRLYVGKNNQNQLEFYKTGAANDYHLGQAYLNFILNPQENYIIEIKLEQMSGQDKFFFFGLVSDSMKDSRDCSDEMLCYSEYNGKYGVNTQIYGKPMVTADRFIESRNLEVRLNLSRKIFKVGQLPSYDSVVQVDRPELINIATPYRFFLKGLNKNTKMTITKIEKVSQFNSNM